MLKTCYNCTHYHTIQDVQIDWHWHDFCDKWGKILDGWNYYRHDQASKVDDIFFDDFETGIAECYMFDAVDNPVYESSWFFNNREHNDKLIEKYCCPDDCDADCNDCPKGFVD